VVLVEPTIVLAAVQQEQLTLVTVAAVMVQAVTEAQAAQV
jgi:hypothetical protein